MLKYLRDIKVPMSIDPHLNNPRCGFSNKKIAVMVNGPTSKLYMDERVGENQP